MLTLFTLNSGRKASDPGIDRSQLTSSPPCSMTINKRILIKAGVNSKAVFWLGIMFLMQISR